ncbi:MAG: hypothetical protein IJS86_08410 [Lachnospiraceae bacterium]|nr:hypothetical protein [Lachnospiraceae bacterium]
MSDEIKMSVSSVTQTKGSKAIYVMFEDRERKAEFVLPECALVSNAGFSREETAALKDYIIKEKESIYGLAKNVDVMDAFMGKKK